MIVVLLFPFRILLPSLRGRGKGEGPVSCSVSWLLLTILLIILYQLRNNLFNGAIDDIVSDGIDWSVWVVVDRDDDTTVLHTSNVLNLSRDTTSDVNLWMDGDTGLTNLTIVVYPTCINSGTAGTNLSMKFFS